MGSGEVFADAITEFAVSYANQNEADYEEFSRRVGFGSDTTQPVPEPV
jgi:hypothetical protein